MAFKKLRESTVFKLMEKEGLRIPLFQTIKRGEQIKLSFNSEKYVIKADEFFNKRMKQGLVVFAKKEEVKEKIKELLNKVEQVIVQEFVPHEEEIFLSFRLKGDLEILIGEGGINVEENWDNIKKVSEEEFKEKYKHLTHLLEFFKKGFYYLEMNPIVEYKNTYSPLGIIAEVDENYLNKYPTTIKEREKTTNNIEEKIKELDKNSHASLKFKYINPNGKLWFLTAGGGASVIYLDEAISLGMEKEIANYAEYSGNPSKEEVFKFSDLILEEMLRKNGKILIIGGGIANFTDVGESFKAIAKALKKHKEKIREKGIKIIIRRGGVNEEEGLEAINKTLIELNIPFELYGREKHLTYPIERAKELLM